MNTQPSSIVDKLKQAQAGDRQAYGEIYQQYFSPLYRYVFFRVGDQAAAEDITQQVFIKVLQQLGSIKISQHSPMAYFYAAARNAVADYWRRSARLVSEPTEVLDQFPGDQPDPGQNLDQAGLEHRLQLAIRQLNEDQQDVIVMKFIEGLSNREIAELLGKSEPAVRQIQSRALKSLRFKLERFTGVSSPSPDSFDKTLGRLIDIQ